MWDTCYACIKLCAFGCGWLGNRAVLLHMKMHTRRHTRQHMCIQPANMPRSSIMALMCSWCKTRVGAGIRQSRLNWRSTRTRGTVRSTGPRRTMSGFHRGYPMKMTMNSILCVLVQWCSRLGRSQTLLSYRCATELRHSPGGSECWWCSFLQQCRVYSYYTRLR